MKLFRIFLFLSLVVVFFSCNSSEGTTSSEEIPAVSINLSSPADQAEEQDLDVVLSWSGEASSFDLYFSESPLDLKLLKSLAVVTYKLEDLKYFTTYYWQVVSKNGVSSKKSEVRSFKTKKKELFINLLSPQNSDTAKYTNRIDFGWSSNAEKYEFYLGISEDSLHQITTDIADTVYALDSLEYGQTYHWQVIASDEYSQMSSDIYSFTTKEQPLVTLASPTEGASWQYTDLTLSWSGENVKTYDLYLGTSENSLSVVASDLADTSYALNNLDYGQKYYWKVMGKDGEEETQSVTNTFTTRDDVAVSLVSPVDSVSTFVSNIKLTWSGNADSYDVYFGTSAQDLAVIAVDTVDTSYSLSTLGYNTTYYWKVVGKSEELDVASEVQSFTTKGMTSLSLNSPTDQATEQFTNLEISWNGSNVDNYDVFLGTAEGSLLEVASDLTTTSYTPEGIEYGQTYYWQVVASYGQLDTASSVYSFTTKEQPLVTLSSPAEGASWQYTDLTLSWSGENVKKYDLYLGTSENSLSVVASDLKDTSYAFNNLDYGQKYYWGIVGKDGEEETQSAVSTFTTRDDVAVSLVSPVDSVSTFVSNIKLTWSGNADSYDVYFGTSAQDLAIIAADTVDTSCSLPTQVYNTTCYWKVVATDGRTSKETEVREFTTNMVTKAELVDRIAKNLDVTQANVSSIIAMKDLFINNATFNQDISDWDVSNVTNMISMFSGASAFNQDISDWDVSKVTHMISMFSGASAFNQDISSWDVSKVISMYCMFSNASSFDQDLSKWDIVGLTSKYSFYGFDGNTSSLWLNAEKPKINKQILVYLLSLNAYVTRVNVSGITDMSDLMQAVADERGETISSCSIVRNFNQDISNWDVSNVTNMSGMFYYATKFNKDISGWVVSNVTDMSDMFSRTYVFNDSLNNWIVSKVTDMSNMFNYSKIFNQDISGWDVSNVTDMSGMFNQAFRFNKDISNWNVDKVSKYDAFTSFYSALKSINEPNFPLTKAELVSKIEKGDDVTKANTIRITDMSELFKNNTTFNQDISGWDVSNVTNMSSMFYNAFAFNDSLSTWDVSNVTDMSYMFYHAFVFDKPLNNWVVSNVTDMSYMFCYASSFDKPLNDWDVNNVSDMSGMFYGARTFNQDINGWFVSKITDMSMMFCSASAFSKPLNDWDVSNVTDMSSMFSGASAFNQDISGWDVINVTNMSNMFRDASAFNDSLNDWNVGNVTNMSYMFCNATAFKQDISSWDIFSALTNYSFYNFGTSSEWTDDKKPNIMMSREELLQMIADGEDVTKINVAGITDMSELFKENTTFNQDISGWDVSNVTDMSSMFYGAEAFNQNINNWDVSNVTDMNFMFRKAEVFNQDISGWDVSSVNDMSFMFAEAATFHQSLNDWDVSNVINMRNMFYGASAFNDSLNNWVVSSVTNMFAMFYQASVFNKPLNDWDVSNVTDMGCMFYVATAFNQNINNWVVSNVTNMSSMFKMASAYDKPLNDWDVSNVTNMSKMFTGATVFNKPLDNWVVSKVTDMSWMFYNVPTFNDSLNNWDVSSVTNMSRMFSGASAFNGSLNNWVVSKVTDMSSMFYYAKVFNQDISGWDVSNVTNMFAMFYGASVFKQDISGWDVSSVTNYSSFDSSTSSEWTSDKKPNW